MKKRSGMVHLKNVHLHEGFFEPPLSKWFWADFIIISLSLSLSLALALALSLFAPKLLSQKKLSTLYRLWKEFWADLDNGKGEIRKSSPSSYCADYAPSALSIQNKSEILFKGKRWKSKGGTTTQWSAYGLRFDYLLLFSSPMFLLSS